LALRLIYQQKQGAIAPRKNFKTYFEMAVVFEPQRAA